MFKHEVFQLHIFWKKVSEWHCLGIKTEEENLKSWFKNGELRSVWIYVVEENEGIILENWKIIKIIEMFQKNKYFFKSGDKQTIGD